MAGKYADLEMMFGNMTDHMAGQVAHMWSTFNNQRATKLAEWQELRNYTFATDTSTTSNGDLPWKNSTVTPKICQIRDNLFSNYISALFPNDNWLRWIGMTEEDQRKSKIIEAYMRDKAHQSKLRDEFSKIVLDYIDYGNCFCTVEAVKEIFKLPNGRTIVGYEGPRLVRISPLDIVFNPTAQSFKESPKIIRSIKHMGEIQELAETDPAWEDAWAKMKYMRNEVGSFSTEDVDKASGIAIDGFGNLQEYYGGSYVEVLTFKGNFYDAETQTSYKNQEIIVVDRSIVVYQGDNDSWLGDGDIIHCGWRKRPDNLYHMGPLDNLIGMQYRIDHLENLKADAMDLCVHPPLVLKGLVEDFEWGPGCEIRIIDEGSVEELSKSFSGMITASNEIASLEAKMEEFAGAPKQAMGIRTPGEKTAFEVSQLENAAGRIFQEKIKNLEIGALEPGLNLMFAVGRQMFRGDTSLRVINDKLGIEVFMSIQPEDLVANGTIRPIGARHFGEQAQLIQNLSQLFAGPLGQMIMPHWSAEKTAKLIEDAMDLDRYGLVGKDKGLVENAQTQDTVNHLNQVVAERQAAPS